MVDKKICLIFLLLKLYCVNSNHFRSSSGTCQKCNPTVEGKINIHLVPHSHDDVGWLQTVDQYYEGTGYFSSIETAGVKYILDSTTAALKANPERRFIQVETAFFWEWWQQQNKTTKRDFINLVNTGQLEIINGGWSMNDEATTHYQSIIDQFTWGFRILNQTLGRCGQPVVGWQIDPFGHSREHASLVKQFGFEGLVIGRIDHQDKFQRRFERTLEFSWKTSDDLENSTIFTTMLPNFYTYEKSFCFDSTCEVMIRVDKETLKDQVEEFAALMDQYRECYQTSNILIPMGGDFTYQEAENSFKSIDMLIEGFKNHEVYSLFYSTPTCYIRAVKKELIKENIELNEKTDDFFPYSSSLHSFWTGYFTSRPTLKRFERLGNNILQSAKQLTAFSRITGKEYDSTITPLRKAMGVMQHHDAITGTEKQAVADDYASLLHRGIKEAEKPIGVIIGNLLRKNTTIDLDLKLSTCLLANVSICATTQKNRFLVAVQNPLSRVITHFVRLPVDGHNYLVTGPDGDEICDIFDTIHTFDYVQENTKPSSRELVFAARNIPPLGVKLYYVQKLSNASTLYKSFKELGDNDDGTYGTNITGFTIDKGSGKLQSVKINGRNLNITQEFLYYSASGNSPDVSGAYIFRPAYNTPKAITTKPMTFKAAKGNLADELIQVLNDEVRQIIRVYKNKGNPYIEFDWLVGDLQYDDEFNGKEIITRFRIISAFFNDGTFYTDSNGRQQIQRQKDTRNDYTYEPNIEPVSSNYYPVTSKITIKDMFRNEELAILNDRAQGGSSMSEGSIELMIHRRLTADDRLGVSEVLNERQYEKGLFVRGQHYLTFGPINSMDEKFSTTAVAKILAQRRLLSPWILVADATMDEFNSFEKVNKLMNLKFEGLRLSLPSNVQILTLEPWVHSYILRLEHILEQNDDDVLSQPVTVDLTNLFTLFNIIEIMETPLGANRESQNGEKFKWQEVKALREENGANPLRITLKPMEIRTFLIRTDLNNESSDDDEDSDDDVDSNSGHKSSACSTVILFITTLYMLL